ncbi:MAG TPA: hypothetical protein PKH50_02765 [bacterium]|jgi:phosphoenolpyruvate carboxylase|nr:hypothetical protein [bacterium]
MTKDKKTNKKSVVTKKLKTKTKEEIVGVEDLEEDTGVEEESGEILPEDIKDALGINKAEKAAKMKEVDYIAELEKESDYFGEDDSEGGRDPDFDGDFDID